MKWREIKQQLIRLLDMALLGCNLISSHSLCVILPTFTVVQSLCDAALNRLRKVLLDFGKLRQD